MAISITKEVNRLAGLDIASGLTVVSGMIAALDTSDTTGATVTKASTKGPYLGLFMETNVSTGTGLNQRDETAGSNKLSVMTNGGYALVWDDGRGCPYLPSDTYTINCMLYSNSDGRITSSAPVTAAGMTNIVGYCTKVPTSSTDSLGVKLVP